MKGSAGVQSVVYGRNAKGAHTSSPTGALEVVEGRGRNRHIEHNCSRQVSARVPACRGGLSKNSTNSGDLPSCSGISKAMHKDNGGRVLSSCPLGQRGQQSR